MAAIVEIGGQQEEGSLRQRWSHYFVLVYAALCILIALNLRSSILNATVPYSDLETGIRARYPANWLLDRQGSYVFRIRDISRIGFKTTIQVALRPLSLNTTTRNLLDSLSLDRAQTLTAYRVLAIEDNQALPTNTQTTQMRYVYVDVSADAVLQTIPTVVEGLDVITIREGQAFIITFLADATNFEAEQAAFERFLDGLEF